MKKKLLVTLIMTMAIFALSGCTGKPQNKAINTGNTSGAPVQYPFTLKDSNNREILVDKEPKRVVSLGPNITEIIYSLGQEKKLIGRTQYCDYPEAVKSVASVGTLKEPNLEKITELNPDFVIASTHFQEEFIRKLESLNIKVAILYGSQSFDGVYDTIGKLGLLLNAQKNADDVILEMKRKVNEVTEKVAAVNKPSVYYVVSYGKGGEFTAGADTFISQMIEMAGGKNAAGDVKGWKYSLEKLVEKNPQIIICSNRKNAKAGLMVTNGYKDLSAVKSGNVHELDNNLVDRQGTRLADGLLALAKIIHPELFR